MLKGLFVMNNLSFLEWVGVWGSAEGISVLNAALVDSGFLYCSFFLGAGLPSILVLSPKAEWSSGRKKRLWNQTAWI